MSSAVLDRILAIPDFDDRPQMGLSRSGLAALVERGGITKDGTKAKSSVLERAGIKGDRPLPSLSMDTKGLSKRETKKKTGKLLRDIRNNKVAIATIQGKGKRAYTRVKGEKTLLQKRAMTDRDIARNAGIAAAKLESQGQINLFNQPKPSAAAIAPDTAKKVKRAIAGVKGGKVTKGQKPVSGRVVESGKTGKDGFTKAFVSIPLQSRKNKSGVALGEPMKGEKIGDYLVSGDSKYGYSVTHIPSGFSVLNSSILKGELGSDNKETAKLAAKKLNEAKIPLPKTFHKMKNSKQPKIQELGRKVLTAIK
jgi:hypothetical protein